LDFSQKTGSALSSVLVSVTHFVKRFRVGCRCALSFCSNQKVSDGSIQLGASLGPRKIAKNCSGGFVHKELDNGGRPISLSRSFAIGNDTRRG
jgi:hypothetical protein